MRSFDRRLGKTLFVKNSSIKPDGGIVEVLDRNDCWRVVLVSESKHQGNDIEKIKMGIKQGKNKDQDLMTAGNAIERVHKNILEMRNFMMDESHFPYIVFLQGTNFATKTHYAATPKGRKVRIPHDAGNMNRIDRVTASNYGMKINTVHCRNINLDGCRLQSASLYFQCHPWPPKDMFEAMMKTAQTSLDVLSSSGAVSLG